MITKRKGGREKKNEALAAGGWNNIWKEYENY